MISSFSLRFWRQVCAPLRHQTTVRKYIHATSGKPLSSAHPISGSSMVQRRTQQSPWRSSSLIRCYSTDLPEGTDPASSSQSMDFIKFDDLSEEEQKKFQVLQFELEVLKQSGNQIPSKLSDNEWRKALNLLSRGQRIKYYRFLFGNEMTEINLKKKKGMLSIERLAKFEKLRDEVVADPSVMRYGLNFNTMYPYIRETDMLKFNNVRLAQARHLGQPLVFDLDYDDWMSEREQTNTATQIRDSHAYNKESRDPFWFQICNAKMKGETMQAMKRGIPNLYDNNCLIEVSEKSYRDIFPHSQLVYLTYNAEATLEKFNHDDIYIIGGLVDKTNPKPLSMAKAKREGLRMAKLPLDIYLRWAVGGKNLTLNQMTGILSDMKLHGDWEKAFIKHIPKRKYLQAEDLDPTQVPYHKQNLRPSAQTRLSSQRRRTDNFRQRGVLDSLLSQ